MNEEQLATLYSSFAQIFANGVPIRRPFEVVAAIQAAGQDPETVTPGWLETLDHDWVYGKARLPFRDPGANRLYQRFLVQG
ncbi:MAG: hypothetical protein WBG86_11635 [Polyangiales bacterium]